PPVRRIASLAVVRFAAPRSISATWPRPATVCRPPVLPTASLLRGRRAGPPAAAAAGAGPRTAGAAPRPPAGVVAPPWVSRRGGGGAGRGRGRGGRAGGFPAVGEVGRGVGGRMRHGGEVPGDGRGLSRRRVPAERNRLHGRYEPLHG